LKKSKLILLLIGYAFPLTGFSQIRISGTTNILVLRSFKEDQRFWAIGQDIIVDWHFTTKEVPFIIELFLNGNFTNQLSANAKTGTTSPQQIDSNGQTSPWANFSRFQTLL
jgi:hypothetical protein